MCYPKWYPAPPGSRELPWSCSEYAPGKVAIYFRGVIAFQSFRGQGTFQHAIVAVDGLNGSGLYLTRSELKAEEEDFSGEQDLHEAPAPLGVPRGG